jgi:hypothetical protein
MIRQSGRLKLQQQKHKVRLRGLGLRTCEGRFRERVAAILIARSSDIYELGQGV